MGYLAGAVCDVCRESVVLEVNYTCKVDIKRYLKPRGWSFNGANGTRCPKCKGKRVRKNGV